MPPPTGRVTRLMQNIIDDEYSLVSIPTITVQDADLFDSDLSETFDHARPIGISPGYSAQGRLLSLAVADDKNCRIVEFAQPRRDYKKTNTGNPKIPQASLDGRALLQEKILCRSVGDLYAFDMSRLSMSLHLDLGLRVVNAIDIQSGFSAVGRKPLTSIQTAVGDTVKIMEKNIIDVFRNPIYDKEDRNRATDLAMRAWVSQFLASYGNGAETFEKVPKIDTLKHDHAILDMIAKIASDQLRLEQLKPLQTQHRFTTTPDVLTGGQKVTSQAYNNKVRKGRNFRIDVRGRGGAYVQRGTIGEIHNGKNAALDTDQLLDDKVIMTLTSIGRDDPTTAEAQRDATVLRILQGDEKLMSDSPWIQNIWFPADDGQLKWPKDWTKPIKPLLPPPQAASCKGKTGSQIHTLNASQQDAVNTMLSALNKHCLTLVQGPPGTGKTSVISTFVSFAITMGHRGIWLVAKSNVAVKNIAEKLLSIGFHNWRLLVSKDFHLGWHEHLYTELKHNLIRSDEFFSMAPTAIEDCQVVLCTLSMLSHFNINKFTSLIPLNTLIVDEASQIEIGDYISVFSSFKDTLRKACFIGDDKQLPPYGQEDLQDLQSIFEVSHLHKQVIFLDTQYRMPPQIGLFISGAVYEEKLNSNPFHPITDKFTACLFIDIMDKEKRYGESYMNSAEAEAAIKLAEQLQASGKNYRFITPYEGQRSTVEKLMQETNGLDWHDKCFNVDSFQGNEEDYIIISIVRSHEMGFLNNLRRTNVMLTRCKKGMFILSSKGFLSGAGKPSLVGQLAEHIGPAAWVDVKELEKKDFLNCLNPKN